MSYLINNQLHIQIYNYTWFYHRIHPLFSLLFLLGLVLGPCVSLNGQVTDSTKVLVSPEVDSLSILKRDSLAPFDKKALGGQGVDEMERPEFGRDPPSEIGETDLDQVEYGGNKSKLDVLKQQVHLYGNAFVKYQDYDIKADYILFDFGANQVTASYGYEGFPGSIRPSFQSGEQNVLANKLRYNFNTNKGLVHDAIVRQSQLVIHGATTKFVKAGSDSLHIDDVIYNRNALITTCDNEQPHWGIRTRKLKMIPNKLAIIGPAQMEIAGIPTPLVIPFAFAPLFNLSAGSSGLIFPSDPFYTDPNLGMGIRGLGYYFALSDKMDLQVTGDIYTRGSWAVNTRSKYFKRYKFRGSFDLGFSRQLLESEGSINPRKQDSYSITLNHRQDAKAHPFRSIGGSLRFTVNDFDRRNVADAQAQINSQINSNFTYSYQINDKLNFSSSITHSQNTLNRTINFTLPDIQLRLRRTNPFDNPNTSGTNDKWFEKIGLQYTGRFENTVSTIDTILFTSETLERFRAGASHDLDLTASYKMLKYFSFNTNIDYSEKWYLQTRDKQFEFVSNDEIDVIDVVRHGFKPFRDISIGAGVNTSIYGSIASSKGWFRGFRHTARPSLSMNYSPATNRYEEDFDEDPLDPFNELSQFNPFSGSGDARLFRSTSLDRGGFSMNYSLQNTFEAKLYSKKDSTEKKIKIFNNINLSGNYNFNADSLKWSSMNMTGTARIFKNISTLSFNARFDPYVKENGRRLNRSVWSEKKRLFRLDQFSVSLRTQFTLEDIRDLFKKENEDDRNNRRPPPQQNKETELFDWFTSFRISHDMRFQIREVNGVHEFQTQTHSISLQSSVIPLTDNWGFRINNISYNFKRKEFVVPQFTVTRDLHCWEMRFSWIPQLDTFSFFIGVKTSPFSQFIKYQTGRDVFGSGISSFR